MSIIIEEEPVLEHKAKIAQLVGLIDYVAALVDNSKDWETTCDLVIGVYDSIIQPLMGKLNLGEYIWSFDPAEDDMDYEAAAKEVRKLLLELKEALPNGFL